MEKELNKKKNGKGTEKRREEAKNFKQCLREKDAMNWKDSGRRKKYWAVVHSRRFPKGDQDPNTGLVEGL